MDKRNDGKNPGLANAKPASRKKMGDNEALRYGNENESLASGAVVVPLSLSIL